jgi:glycosyltransferase involved in cell wall biosynthesis
MSMQDLYTIAFPVYKRTDFIRTALDSAVNQTVKCRILLIDNNSPHDDFKQIVDSYKNPLIKYIKTSETVHQDENFNNCFRYTETPWLTILHDDDTLHCQYVEFAQKLINNYPDLGGFAVDCMVGEEEWQGIHDKVELTNDIKRVGEPFFYFSNLSAFPGVTIKREIALKLKGFHVDLHPIADNDLWYRFARDSKVLLVNQKLAYYRVSPAQSTNRLMEAMINDVYKYRLNLIKKGRHNNLITRLALEESRLNNIAYFYSMYNDVQMPPKLFNRGWMRMAKILIALPKVRGFLNRYRNKISFISK